MFNDRFDKRGRYQCDEIGGARDSQSGPEAGHDSDNRASEAERGQRVVHGTIGSPSPCGNHVAARSVSLRREVTGKKSVSFPHQAIVTRTIEIKPGEKTSHDVSLNVGRIKLKVVSSAGGPAIDKRLYVYELTPKGSVGELYDDLPNNYEWVLAAGTYALRFQGSSGQVERKFSVQAGAHTSEEIVAP